MVPGTVRVGGSHQTKAPRELDPDSSGTPHLASFSGHVKMQTALEVPNIQVIIFQVLWWCSNVLAKYVLEISVDTPKLLSAGGINSRVRS